MLILMNFGLQFPLSTTCTFGLFAGGGGTSVSPSCPPCAGEAAAAAGIPYRPKAGCTSGSAAGGASAFVKYRSGFDTLGPLRMVAGLGICEGSILRLGFGGSGAAASGACGS